MGRRPRDHGRNQGRIFGGDLDRDLGDLDRNLGDLGRTFGRTFGGNVGRDLGSTLAALLLACAPARTESQTPAVAPAPASAPAAGEDEPACPTIDPATLESTATPDPRTIELRRVFLHKQPRAGSVAAKTFDLGALRLPAHAPYQKGGGGGSLGFRGLEPDVLAGVTSPELAPQLRAYFDAWEEFSAAHQISYDAGLRAAHVDTLPLPDEWGGRACLERFAARAEQRAAASKQTTERASLALKARLETLPDPRPADVFLLAYLQFRALEYPHPPAEDARLEAIFTRVAGDESLGRELRARAAEQSAMAQRHDDPRFVATLERAVELTQDPEQRVERLSNLASVVGGDRAEAVRAQIIELLEETGKDWRLAHTLGDLADDRLDRGAYELARVDAARCARASPADFPHDPDPWGCAETLAEATAELAGAPMDGVVPLTFLGPLALASIRSALGRHDYDQAEHVGRLLLAELPEAAEVPQVIAHLQALADSPAARDELEERRLRDYGPASAWAARQRERLAWGLPDPESVDRALTSLLAGAEVVGGPPRTPDERRRDVQARAIRVAETCRDVLPTSPKHASLRVDTRGPLPRVTIDGVEDEARDCLRRAARARFRSLGPARVRAQLSISD